MKNRNEKSIHTQVGKEGLQSVMVQLFSLGKQEGLSQSERHNVLELTVQYINQINDQQHQIFESIKKGLPMF